MDQEMDRPSSGARRKVRFMPRAPPQRRPTRPIIPKTEVNDDSNNPENEAAQAEKLMNKFTANLRRNVPKTEKTSSVQVAFGPGASSSTGIRKFGAPRVEHTGKNSCLEAKGSTDYDVNDDDAKMVVSSPSTAQQDGMMKHPADTSFDLAPERNKSYKEPWDYQHSYYPTTLPLRRPYSGDPELLDEAEFGSTTDNLGYNENNINPSSELGVLEKCDNERLFLFKLPPKLPIKKRSAAPKEKAGSSKSGNRTDSKETGSLAELSAGYVGKMLVYQNGAVKLKQGDVLYDVSPGVDSIFAEDVVAINTAATQYCVIGELGKHAVVYPDVDSLLNSAIDLG